MFESWKSWKIVQKLYVRQPGNRKHRCFITWIFYQLTDICSNYAMQWLKNVWYLRSLEKLAIKMWFPFNFGKNLKGRHFVIRRLTNLKLSPNTDFGVSLQKNVLSRFLLFWSVCYSDGLSDSERNEIASSASRNFNNNWLLYVKFLETINLFRNVWLMENWKFQLFLFLK